MLYAISSTIQTLFNIFSGRGGLFWPDDKDFALLSQCYVTNVDKCNQEKIYRYLSTTDQNSTMEVCLLNFTSQTLNQLLCSKYQKLSH